MSRDAVEVERRFEPLDGIEVIAPVGGREPEPDCGSACGDRIACGARLCEDFLELQLRGAGVRVEAKLKLCVGKLQLPVVDFPDVTAGLEVFDGHAELLRQLPQSLD